MLCSGPLAVKLLHSLLVHVVTWSSPCCYTYCVTVFRFMLFSGLFLAVTLTVTQFSDSAVFWSYLCCLLPVTRFFGSCLFFLLLQSGLLFADVLIVLPVVICGYGFPVPVVFWPALCYYACCCANFCTRTRLSGPCCFLVLPFPVTLAVTLGHDVPVHAVSGLPVASTHRHGVPAYVVLPSLSGSLTFAVSGSPSTNVRSPVLSCIFFIGSRCTNRLRYGVCLRLRTQER